MIAERSCRGQGLGWQAMTLMLRYGISHLSVDVYEAKIKIHNEKSIKMFQKLKFEEHSRSEVFGEVTLRVRVTEEWKRFICEQTEDMEIKDYL